MPFSDSDGSSRSHASLHRPSVLITRLTWVSPKPRRLNSMLFAARCMAGWNPARTPFGARTETNGVLNGVLSETLHHKHDSDFARVKRLASYSFRSDNTGMTTMQSTNPLAAAMELERRGVELPGHVRSALDQARRRGEIPTPGLNAPGMTIRGRELAPAGYTDPTFRLPGGARSYPRWSASNLPSATPSSGGTDMLAPPAADEDDDPILQTQPSGPGSTYRSTPTYGPDSWPTVHPRKEIAPDVRTPTMTPYGEQALLSTGAATDPDLRTSQILSEERKTNLPHFRNMSYDQQVEYARNKARLTSTGPFTAPEVGVKSKTVDAQKAAALQAAHESGEITLMPKEHDEIRKTMAARADEFRNQNLQRTAAGMGVASSMALSAASAASFGAGPAIRNLIQPELQGLEGHIAEESPRLYFAGQLVGAAAPVLGAARTGAAIAGGIASKLGPTGQGASKVAGRFIGGEAIQAPLMAGQALSQGQDVGDAAMAGFDAATSIPVLMAKMPSILSGDQELTIEDRLDLAFMVLDAAGIPGDFSMYRKQVRAAEFAKLSPREQQALALAEILSRSDEPVHPKLIEKIVMDSLDPETRGVPQQNLEDAPIQKNPNEGLTLKGPEGDAPNLDEFGRLMRGEAHEGVTVETDPNTGIKYQIQTLGDGSIRYAALDEQGNFISEGFAPDAETARQQIQSPLEKHVPEGEALEGPKPALKSVEGTKTQEAPIKVLKPAKNVAKLAGEIADSDPEVQKAEAAHQLEQMKGLEGGQGLYRAVDIPISELELDPSKVSGPRSKAAVSDFAARDPNTSPPIIAGRAKGQAGGKLTVIDGNHRVAAALARGETTIKANLPWKLAEEIENNAKEAKTKKAEAVPEPPVKTEPPVVKADPEVKAESELKPVDKMTVRELRAEAKKYGVPQFDNERGQTTLRARLAQAREARTKGSEYLKQRDAERQKIADEKKAEAEAAKKTKEKAPDETKPKPKEEPVPEEPKDTEVPDDFRETTEAARTLLEKDPLKVKWSDVPDEVLLKAIREGKAGSSILAALEIQRKSRSLSEAGITDAEIRTRMYESRLSKVSPELLPSAIKNLPSDILGILAGKKRGGRIFNALQAEAKKRGVTPVRESRPRGGGSGEVGSPARGSESGSPSRSETGLPFVGTKETGSKIRDRIQARRRGKELGRSLGDINGPHQIISRLAKALDLGPLGVGARKLKKRYLGWILVTPEAIRQRLADDMDTYAHEIGHFLHKLVLQDRLTEMRNRVDKRGRVSRLSASGLVEGKIPSSWHAELEVMGKALYGKTKPFAGYVSEGLAELGRLMFTDPAQAFAKAPNAFTDLSRMLGKDFPEQYKALLDFRNLYQLYHTSSPATKAMTYIRRANEPRGPIRKQLLAAYDRARTLMFDRFQALVRMKRDLGIKDGELRADEDPHTSALRATGRAYGDLQRALDYGRWDPHTLATEKDSKGLTQILAPAKDNIPELDAYMALLRVIEKRKQNHKGVFAGLSDAEIKEAVKEIEEIFPHFKQIAKEFQEFNEWLIRDYAVGHGLITPEQAEAIISKNLHYITFKKVKTEDQGPPARTTSQPRKFVDTGSGIRRFAKFQGEQIDPPIESFIASMEGIMRRAQLNRVGQSIVRLFDQDPRLPKGSFGGVEQMGRWLDKIDRPLEMSKVEGDLVVSEMKKRLRAAGYDVDSGDLDAIFHLMEDDDFRAFRPGIRTDKGSRQFIVMRDGKPTFWEAKNQALFDVLEGLGNAPTANLFFRSLRNIYRAGATTLNPEFSVINFIRDGFQALTMTDKQLAVSTRFKAWMKAFKTGDPGEMFTASGASMSSLFGEYMNPRTKKLDLNRMFGKKHVIRMAMKEKKYAKMMGEIAKSPLDLIRNINERAEMANRLSEFEVQLLGKTDPTRADIEAAGQAAADITLDFQRGGTSALSVNQLVPFFNAAFQGADRLARFIKKNPARAFGRIFNYIIAPSLTLHMMNRKDEEYWKKPYQERDRYWHIPIGDVDFDGEKEWIKIPKPYGLGAFSVAVERMLAKFDGIDPVTGKHGDSGAFEGAAGSVLIDPVRPPYTIPIATPLFELVANYSIFFEGGIVRTSEQSGPIHERGAERSSEVAFALGKIMNVEPPKIDYAINGVFAGLGKSASDFIISPAVRAIRVGVMGGEPKPQKVIRDPLSIEQMYLLRRVLTTESKGFTEITSRFWRQWDELENVYKGFTGRKETPDRADEYLTSHEAEIEAYKNMQPYKATLDKLYASLRRTYRTTESGASKKDMFEEQSEIFQEIETISKEALNNIYQLRDEKKD